MVSRLVGLYYPGHYVSYAERDATPHIPPRVLVVLIDDAFLQNPASRGQDAVRRGQWPIRWAEHAYLLREVVRYGPKAVFLDFGFRSPNAFGATDSPDPDVNALRQAIKDSVEDGVPIVLGEIVPPVAATPPGGRDCPVGPDGPSPQAGLPVSTHPALACVASALAPIVWQFEDYPEAYPMAVALPGPSGQAGGAALLTPAPALLRAVSRLEELAAGAEPGGRSPPRTEAPQPDDKMLVAWDLRGSPLELLRTAGADCDRSNRLLASLLALAPGLDALWTQQMLKRHRNGPVTRGEPCLPVDVISAQQVVATPDQAAAKNGPTVAALLRGSYVLIGSGRGPGDPDRVELPFDGQVPGVLLHAMALDNLLHYGSDNYLHFQEEKFFDLLTPLDLASFAAILAALVTNRTLRRHAIFWGEGRLWGSEHFPKLMFLLIFLIIGIWIEASFVDLILTIIVVYLLQFWFAWTDSVHDELANPDTAGAHRS